MTWKVAGRNDERPRQRPRPITAIERIAVSKYQRGKTFNRQHPFVDILLSDITESEETLDMRKLVREPLPPTFQRMSR